MTTNGNPSMAAFRAYLADEKLHYYVNEDGTRIAVIMPLRGAGMVREMRYTMFLSGKERAVIACSLPVYATEDRIAQAEELCARINYAVNTGCWSVDRDGEIHFRESTWFEGELTTELVRRMFELTYFRMKTECGAFLKLITGEASPEELARKVLGEDDDEEEEDDEDEDGGE